ncbi:MAG: hypothetical protein ACXQS8_07070 [Candidatus Helarchaeales archaeon]
MPKTKTRKRAKQSKSKTKKISKITKKKSRKTLKYFEDLLASKFTNQECLEHLMRLSNVSFKLKESRESMIEKIMYESVLGLDEAADILYNETELRAICKYLGLKNLEGKTKSNLIGMILKQLPPRKQRKIETVIDERVEEERDLHIYNVFIMHPDGCCLYSYNLEPISVGDVQIITSALNAIDLLVREITKSQKHLDSIDIKDKELIFEYGKMDLTRPGMRQDGPWTLIGVLLLNEDSSLARKLLREVVERFEKTFEKDLLEFNGCLDKFEAKGDEIIKDIFDFYFK